jgi:hypothetical protein
MKREPAVTEHTVITCLELAHAAAGMGGRNSGRYEVADAEELWAYKRQQQSQDLHSLRTGRATEDDMSWFSGGRARRCRLINSPY